MINDEDEDEDDNHLIKANLNFSGIEDGMTLAMISHKSVVYPLFLRCVAQA